MRVNENNAAPRPYELARPEELARLMNECCGYLRTCRAAQHGTDSDGRGHAIDALPRAADEIASLRAQLAEAVGLLDAAEIFVKAAPIKHPQQGPVKVDLLEAIRAVVSRNREQGGK